MTKQGRESNVMTAVLLDSLQSTAQGLYMVYVFMWAVISASMEGCWIVLRQRNVLWDLHMRPENRPRPYSPVNYSAATFWCKFLIIYVIFCVRQALARTRAEMNAAELQKRREGQKANAGSIAESGIYASTEPETEVDPFSEAAFESCEYVVCDEDRGITLISRIGRRSDSARTWLRLDVEDLGSFLIPTESLQHQWGGLMEVQTRAEGRPRPIVSGMHLDELGDSLDYKLPGAARRLRFAGDVVVTDYSPHLAKPPRFNEKRQTANADDDSPRGRLRKGQVVPLNITLLWKPTSPRVVTEAGSTNLVSYAMSTAMEPWSAALFNEMRRNRLRRIEQWGNVAGYVNIDGLEFPLDGCGWRCEARGHQISGYYYRSVGYLVMLEDGTRIHFEISGTLTLSHLVRGYVIRPHGGTSAIIGTHTPMWTIAEGLRPNRKHTIEFEVASGPVTERTGAQGTHRITMHNIIESQGPPVTSGSSDTYYYKGIATVNGAPAIVMTRFAYRRHGTKPKNSSFIRYPLSVSPLSMGSGNENPDTSRQNNPITGTPEETLDQEDLERFIVCLDDRLHQYTQIVGGKGMELGRLYQCATEVDQLVQHAKAVRTKLAADVNEADDTDNDIDDDFDTDSELEREGGTVRKQSSFHFSPYQEEFLEPLKFFVPKVATLTAAAWRHQQEHSVNGLDLQDAINRVYTCPKAELESQCRRLRRMILRTSLEPTIEKAVRDALRETFSKTEALAIRSSGVDEDVAHSLAGQNSTYLFVRGVDSVLQRIVQCWASQFEYATVLQRLSMDLEIDPGIAVIIQAMVTGPALSGLLVTSDESLVDTEEETKEEAMIPKRMSQRSKDGNVREDSERDAAITHMVISTVDGIGTGATDGSGNPDTYYVCRPIWLDVLEKFPRPPESQDDSLLTDFVIQKYLPSSGHPLVRRRSSQTINSVKRKSIDSVGIMDTPPKKPPSGMRSTSILKKMGNDDGIIAGIPRDALEALVQRVCCVGAVVERYFSGSGRAVEFVVTWDGISNTGKVYLLQCRPVTEGAPVENDLIGTEFDTPLASEGEWLSRSTISELMPTAMTPLTLSTFAVALEHGIQDLLRSSGIMDTHMDTQKFLPIFRNNSFLNLYTCAVFHTRTAYTSKAAMDMTLCGRVITEIPFKDLEMFTEGDSMTSGQKRAAFVRFLLCLARTNQILQDLQKKHERFDERRLSARYVNDAAELFMEIDSYLQLYRQVWSCLVALTARCGHWTNLLLHILNDEGSSMDSGKWTVEHYADLAELLGNRADGLWGGGWGSAVDSGMAPDIARSLEKLAAQTMVDLEAYGMKPVEESSRSELLTFLLEGSTPAGRLFEAFLQAHGHRCSNEVELMSRTWREDPLDVIGAIRKLAVEHGDRLRNEVSFVGEEITSTPDGKGARSRCSTPGSTPRDLSSLASISGHDNSSPRSDTLGTTQLNTSLSYARRLALIPVRRLALAAMRDRDRGKSFAIEVALTLRRGYRTLAEMLAVQGDLPAAELLYFMTHTEIQRLCFMASEDQRSLGGNRFRSPTRDGAAPQSPKSPSILPSSNQRARRSEAIILNAIKRKRQFDTTQRKVRFPMLTIGTPNPIIGRMRTQTLSSAVLAARKILEGTLRGLPACKGQVTGRARVLTDLGDAPVLRYGDILVITSMDIGWSPYFPMLKGIVTESGGLLSHGALCAREYGIPCIVSVPGVTQLVSTGDYVLLNATKGELQLLQNNIEVEDGNESEVSSSLD
eukprot:Clim_evm27s143 gene=Clim_evmTU27s143